MMMVMMTTPSKNTENDDLSSMSSNCIDNANHSYEIENGRLKWMICIHQIIVNQKQLIHSQLQQDTFAKMSRPIGENQWMGETWHL